MLSICKDSKKEPGQNSAFLQRIATAAFLYFAPWQKTMATSGHEFMLSCYERVFPAWFNLLTPECEYFGWKMD